MGCVSSKQARSPRSPSFDHRHRRHHRQSSVKVRDNGNGDSGLLDTSSSQIKGGFGQLEKIKEEPEKEIEEESARRQLHSGSIISKHSKKGNNEKRAAFSIKFGRLTEGEHVAAGWPAWLSAVAGEAIEGWLPLRSDTFERLEKIGQGTYSSVYRARDVDTGKMVALKKVRFDNFQPDSVRFMAREITVLRKLDHPNIMKLEGIITSRLSCSIYLVFEYMEHDLSGLLSSPDIKFSESQIKCYMKQLLDGVQHCHSRGVMHRDIKTSNILVNNEGILKIADFGLANYVSSRHRQPLTSRVVTLWYRPPELLLGSTSYGVTVDLWSVGCVFAELFIGRPLLKGRTEVEQLHKIFKLCGSPPDDHWKNSRLPLATMFKPQQPYESTLRERCKELPKTAVKLIETFLSIEPSKRGSASASLESEYFITKPYACDPSSLPKYPPNKEIDAKFREEARRKKAGGISRASGASRNMRRVRKPLQEPSNFCKVLPTEEMETYIQVSRRNNGANTHISKGRATESHSSMKAPYDTLSEASQMTEESQVNTIVSVPVEMTASSGFAWAKRHKQDSTSSRLYGHAPSGSHKWDTVDSSSVLRPNDTLDSDGHENGNFTRVDGSAEIRKPFMHRQRTQPRRLDSFDSSDKYQSQNLSVDYADQRGRFRSGPLSTPRRTDARQDSQPHQAVRRSRFYRGKRRGTERYAEFTSEYAAINKQIKSFSICTDL